MQLRVVDQVVRHARPRIEHVPQTRLASGSLVLQSEKQDLNNKYKIKKIVEYSWKVRVEIRKISETKLDEKLQNK